MYASYSVPDHLQRHLLYEEHVKVITFIILETEDQTMEDV